MDFDERFRWLRQKCDELHCSVPGPGKNPVNTVLRKSFYFRPNTRSNDCSCPHRAQTLLDLCHDFRKFHLQPLIIVPTAGDAVIENATWPAESANAITFHCYEPLIAEDARSFICDRFLRGIQTMKKRSGIVLSITWGIVSLGRGS
jgi:hypothetical protein